VSAHERLVHDQPVEPGSDRSFGVIVGGIVVAISVIQLVSGSPQFVWLMIPGVILVAVALLAPARLHPLNLAWTRLGLMLGRIVSPIIMFLIFVLSVVPTGLLLRLFGKDPLRLRRDTEANSYWIARDPPGPPPESLKDQF
jgi:hypothetical protein